MPNNLSLTGSVPAPLQKKGDYVPPLGAVTKAKAAAKAATAKPAATAAKPAAQPLAQTKDTSIWNAANCSKPVPQNGVKAREAGSDGKIFTADDVCSIKIKEQYLGREH